MGGSTTEKIRQRKESVNLKIEQLRITQFEQCRENRLKRNRDSGIVGHNKRPNIHVLWSPER